MAGHATDTGRMSDLRHATTFAIAINAAGGVAPTEIVLLPAGAVPGRDGRAWVNDRPDDVVAAFKAYGADLPIDVEHATELKGPKGEPAPAHGWIKSLSSQDGAIRARVEWTEDGARLITSNAYRYISPAFGFQKTSGRVTHLVSAGLTNKPNLHIPALNSQETDMDRAALAAALGIAATSTDADIVTAINSIKTKAETPDPTHFVPKADLDQALNRATTAEQKLADQEKVAAEQKSAALVDQAVKDGKIAPASKDHYLALCRAEGGYAQVEALLKTLPKIVGDGGSLDDRRPDDPPAATDDPVALASQAQAYRAAQAKLGIQMSISDAVIAVKENRK